MTNLPLAGRNAVVTGAASGIGAAIAERLAADGAAVALVSRRQDRLDDLAGKLGPQAFGVGMDVTSPDSVDPGTARLAAGPGRPAGERRRVMLAAPVEQVRLDDWTRMIDTNLTGALRLIGALHADLIAAGSQGRTADLVNISSIGAHLVFPGTASTARPRPP